ncbi:hypothetical protein QMG61_02685 [Cryobacterium sp. PH31-AA6]|uniref:hypothetical protein n=1 Tax=Cryobacterium sp. PH31-AA6 TaxID=3046205 RepID=UPI0024B88CA4|nr:hypothetical protein [Cryobacterium sp. PH31-AA6]MDJ0322669.1 hypothetical protein [Cryobacterium sp. PH31-AA6]
MASTDTRGGWRRRWWIPAVALVALLISGGWLVSQQPSSGWGPGSGWDQSGMGGNGWVDDGAGPVENLKQARERAAAYAETLQPGLEVGEVMRFENHYYADLQEPDGSKVTEVLINSRSGAVQPEMGPATMWNTRFSMMGGSAGSESDMSATQAQQIADRWLADHDEGLTSEDATKFPGYYTLHTVRDGEITGMLSVRASTGDVWFHSWHGDFVEMSEHS